jgi:hypothetical protein
MNARMSGMLSGNSKILLAFAGFVIVGAGIAATSFDGIGNSDTDTAEMVGQGEANSADSAPAPEAAPAGWAEDGLSDDWDAGADYTAADIGFSSSDAGSDAGNNVPSESAEDPGFQNYNPPEAQSSGSQQRPGGSPAVTTRAAPGAPMPGAPGAGSETLQEAE